ncbi:transglycosylase domain-containing protein [Kitasatospora sp. YST-16]|uniref:transglycosylase domain-containing protein n=1 Tax=Kitasatospora sp. YST-16 TaxID=2998080 RepID=UPI002283FF43|nr:transglycosylase domain-containing protein [Kitasatospora sp. YST-16]WAL72640.1 transglycosylase domain-containing protein [Kitasatospora sp. YST-16]WNW38688.1 transglycosylase domain-containing protein [Streptomyces sp. Li-HN-5-13]
MAPTRSTGSLLDKAGHGVKFLGGSILAGVLVAGMALPAVGAFGLTAKDTAESFDNIPDDFKQPPLSQVSMIYDAKGGLIAKVYDRDRTILTAEQMAPVMRQAQVDIEDARFYEHGAIDLKGVLRAVTKNAESGTTAQGASTLTQQYVKNVFVEQAGDDQAAFLEATKKSLGRKIQELKYAIKLEEDLSKDQILTNYLNITFYGHQAYGVEAAANRYFSKSAKDLTVPEAAMLAGLVQNPTAYDPIAHPQAAQTRRNTVINKLLEYKHITPEQAKDALAAPLGIKYSEPQNGCITADKGMGFFCDYVRHVIKQDPAFGATAADRQKLWSQGGLKINTTIDPDKQNAMYNAVTKKVYVTDPVSAAGTMIEPGTGKILAMAQTRPYGLDTSKNQTVLNLNVGASMGGGNGFSPGSTFKPIVAAAALESGIPITQEYPSPYSMEYPKMTTCDGTTHDPQTLTNEAAGEQGPYSLQVAMQKSVNTYFIQLEQQVGLCPVKQMTDKLGLGTLANGTKIQQVASMTLGTQEVSPLQMATAYAAFAARGLYCSPIAINSVTGGDGKEIHVPGANCNQAMTQTTADGINTLLLGVTEKGTGSALGLDDGRQIAGKTGTTDKRYAAWFTGYTPNLATSVWLGGVGGNVSMRNVRIGGHYFDAVYGSDGPGPIWQKAMNDALDGSPAASFQKVDIPQPTQPPATPNPGDSPSTPSGDNAQGGGNGWPTGGGNGGAVNGGFTLPPNVIGGNTGKPGRH